MNNQLKSKTRLAFIQIVFQHISTNNNINEILDSFNINYKSTFVDNFNGKKKIKFEFNSNFLKKLIFFYSDFIKKDYVLLIDKYIDFNRKFEKWDIINKTILLAALSELKNSESNKIKIIFNDYLNVSKFFVNQSDISIINAILDKILNDKK
jgi:transcription termination factor NusB